MVPRKVYWIVLPSATFAVAEAKPLFFTSTYVTPACGLAVTESLTVLLAALGSFCVAATTALLTSAPGSRGLTTTCTVGGAPGFGWTDPSAQVSTPAASGTPHEPWLGVA